MIHQTISYTLEDHMTIKICFIMRAFVLSLKNAIYLLYLTVLGMVSVAAMGVVIMNCTMTVN